MAARGSIDEEDDQYWGTSKVSKLKSFGINQFDEDDNVDFKSVISYLKEGCDLKEEEDVINWDGTRPPKASASSENLSARYKPGGSTVQIRPAQNTGSVISGLQGDRGITPPAAVRPASLQRADIGISNISIGDVVSGKKPSIGGKTDHAKLEAEVNYLRRTVQTAKREKYDAVPVKDTVRRIIFGQDFTLELYRSKEQKLQLLDEAIRCHDGDAIITAILFLRNTVKSSIFNLELMQRPVAIDHYVSYLKQSGDTTKLMDMYGMLGRTEEAAMTKFKQATSIKDAEKKAKSLEVCKRAHFDSEPSLGHEGALIQQQILAISQQLPVEQSDKLLEQQGTDTIMKAFPRKASIVDQPVITWLFYCCFYHYTLPGNNFASPESIKKVHYLSEKQYLWTAMKARAMLKVWKDVETLFLSKGWLGSTKMRCPLGFHRIVPVLAANGAPREILNKYCKLIEEADQRIEVGQKFNCFEAVIETMVQQRDRQRLTAYHNSLKANSQEWFYAGERLKNSGTKWKN